MSRTNFTYSYMSMIMSKNFAMLLLHFPLVFMLAPSTGARSTLLNYYLPLKNYNLNNIWHLDF